MESLVRKALAALAVLAAAAPAAPAALGADRSETVKFRPGAISATLSGSIKGYDGVNYLFEARAGQVASLLFAPSNRSCYFNVFAPGADSAVHIGSSSGNEFGSNLTASGTYRAQVYLMRNAARRGERCKYKLTIEISGGDGAAAPARGAEELPMLRACVAQATTFFGVAEDKIRFENEAAVMPSKTGYAMNGVADKGAEGQKPFKCLFGKDRALKTVMPLISDGE